MSNAEDQPSDIKAPKKAKQSKSKHALKEAAVAEEKKKEKKASKSKKAPKTADSAPVGTETDKVKKPHKWRPGTVVQRDIKRLTRSTEPLVPFAPISRCIREVLSSGELNSPKGEPLRLSGAAVSALHAAGEDEIIQLLRAGNIFTLHNKRVTIMPKDLRAASKISNGPRLVKL
jgi:histone H3